jgi:hypothetical protein
VNPLRVHVFVALVERFASKQFMTIFVSLTRLRLRSPRFIPLFMSWAKFSRPSGTTFGSWFQDSFQSSGFF